MWALGCVALPYTVKTHRAVTTAAAVAAAGDVYLDLQLHAKGLAAGFGNSNAVVDSAPLSMLLLYLGVAAFTAAAAHNADVPDIKADRAAGVKTIAAAVGHGNAVLVSVALAAVGTLAGLATGCVWLAGVGPLALSATFATAAGWHDAGIMLDDLQGMLAGLLAALLV
jgi:4-hydroxybenzoate polyprenyltransferase